MQFFYAMEDLQCYHAAWGMGYAKEYHVERFLRGALIPRITRVSPELLLCFIAEKVLGLPKSY